MDNAESVPSADSGLTAFDCLLRKLDPDRTRAGEKYENLRRKLVRFFEWNLWPRAEELADDTLDRLGERLQREDIRDLAAFAVGVARKVGQEAHRKAVRHVHLKDVVESRADAGQGLEEDLGERLLEGRRVECVNRCLQKFSAAERELFLAYRSGSPKQKGHRELLAAAAGLSLGTLRVRINRLRERLQACAQECLTRTRPTPHGPGTADLSHPPAGDERS